MRRGAVVVTIALAISAASYVSVAPRADARTPSAHASAPPAPHGDLYRPPQPLPPGKPGQIIWAQRVKGITFTPPQTVWRFLYHSRDQTGHDVAVSAFAIIPNTAAPKTGRAVYAWAHGTTGLGDQCAPSRAIRDNIPPYAGELVSGNALVVATDYEGLGTPGDHTYDVGRAEGQAVLDSVRAAAALPKVGTLGDVLLAGHSQGGGAALFAAQLAAQYAPKLHLRGVLASAPSAELRQVATALQSSPSKGLLLLAASGLRAAYPNLDVSAALTPAAIADLPRVALECVDDTVARYQSRPAGDILIADPSQVPSIARILDDNSPGAVNPLIPIMIVQGDHDEQIPVEVSAELAAKYCALHAIVNRRIYPDASHEEVLDAAHDEIVAWLNARYEERPAKNTCTVHH